MIGDVARMRHASEVRKVKGSRVVGELPEAKARGNGERQRR